MDNEFRKLLASFGKIIPLKYPSDLQDSTTLTAKLLTRSEGTIGELETLLAAAATEAMRSGTERFTEEIIDGSTMYRHPRENRGWPVVKLIPVAWDFQTIPQSSSSRLVVANNVERSAAPNLAKITASRI
jgi:hypothetical protein